MQRRNAIKLTLGALAAGGASAVALTQGFKNEVQAAPVPKNLVAKDQEHEWKYVPLDPQETAELAYNNYPKGSCMYGVFSSIVEQLADKIGEPFASFPIQMMKYGHGGVNGYGSICGTLNGAAAIFGLFIPDKKIIDALAAELFQFYETEPLPTFVPSEPANNFENISSISNSILCHASTTRWVNKAGFTIASKERKERCRRLTGEIAAKTVEILNSYFANTFMANIHDNETVRTCNTCHSSKGKVANTAVKMDCDACHQESLPHRFLSDIHYKNMKQR